MLGEILIGVAGLAVGSATGYVAAQRGLPRPGSGGNASSGQPAEPGPPSLAGTFSGTAADDWAAAERGRAWETQRPVPGESGPQPAADPQPGKDRDRLVQVSVDLADRLRERQPALYKSLRRDLESVGVEVLAPDGERFDPQRHNAVGTEPAAEPGQHLVIAETMRLGYADRGTEVRAPDVIVYRAD
jgi:hypothetical protein